MKLTMSTENQYEQNLYGSADLGLAAAIYLSYPLEAIDKQNPRKATFYFKRDAGLDELVASYWRKEITVEPQSYFNALRVIKTRLYGEQ